MSRSSASSMSASSSVIRSTGSRHAATLPLTNENLMAHVLSSPPQTIHSICPIAYDVPALPPSEGSTAATSTPSTPSAPVGRHVPSIDWLVGPRICGELRRILVSVDDYLVDCETRLPYTFNVKLESRTVIGPYVYPLGTVWDETRMIRYGQLDLVTYQVALAFQSSSHRWWVRGLTCRCLMIANLVNQGKCVLRAIPSSIYPPDYVLVPGNWPGGRQMPAIAMTVAIATGVAIGFRPDSHGCDKHVLSARHLDNTAAFRVSRMVEIQFPGHGDKIGPIVVAVAGM